MKSFIKKSFIFLFFCQKINYLAIIVSQQQPGVGYATPIVYQQSGIVNQDQFNQQKVNKTIKEQIIDFINIGKVNVHNAADQYISNKLDKLFSKQNNQFLPIDVKEIKNRKKLENYVRAFNALWQLITHNLIMKPEFNINQNYILIYNLIGALAGFNKYNDVGFSPEIIDFTKTIVTNNRNNMVANKQIFFIDNFFSKEKQNLVISQFMKVYDLFITLFNQLK